MMSVRILGLALGLSAVMGITKVQRKRQAKQDLLSMNCIERSACMRLGDNMIGSIVTEFPFHPPGIQSNRQSCQEACAGTAGCKFFTWYDRDGAFPFQCFLYSSCREREEDCAHCYTGPGLCRPEAESCSPLTEDYGGTWYCYPDIGLNQPVPSGTKCIWQCPGQSLYHQCEAGQWNERPGQTRCMCNRIGERHPGEVLCYPPVSMSQAVTSGTYCLHTCHGHTKTEMMCHHSLWSTDPASLSCEGNNATSFDQLRPQGKSLEVMPTKDQMGLIADTKIAQMKTKDMFDKPMMKTKIDGRIVTMKKVNYIPNFLSNIKNQNPAPSPQNIIQNLASSRENFMQKLLQASIILQGESEEIGAVTTDNSEDRFPPLVQVNDNDPQTRPEQLTATTVRPSLAEFFPSQSEDDLQFFPISNSEKPSKTKAIFPQNEKEDDEIIFITEKPQVNELNNFGFHEIQSPSVVQKPVGPQAHIVRSQLVVGEQKNPIPEQKGKFSNIFPAQRQKAEEQLEQLEELEDLLETTDSLSPLTLEMVQTALISLKQKKSIAMEQGRQLLQRQEKLMARGAVGAGGRSNHQMKAARKYLASLEHIAVKEKAPLLAPHRGDHMIPMSDVAINKQNKLRDLRNEMMQMKHKIHQLEAQGISPSREDVQPHLNNIKKFSFEQTPKTAQKVRPVRAPIKLDPSFLPRVPTKMLDNLLPPSRVNIAAKPPVVHHQHQPVQVRLQTQASGGSDGSGVGRGEVRGRTNPPTIDYTKLRAVADLESDIGEVVDGLTELADRFPDDFNSLMKTFHEREVSVEPQQRDISAMDILNLANIITQVNEEVKCKKPAEPRHGRIVCNSLDMMEGTKCLLECDYGYVSQASDLTVCQPGNRWSVPQSRLGCVRPVAMLLGGYNAQEGLLADVEIFSARGKCSAVRVPPIPGPRRGLIASWVGGQVLVCGGRNNTDTENKCWAYQAETNQWREVGSLNKERHFSSALATSGSLIVLGGRDGSAAPVALGDLEQWQTETESWLPVSTRLSVERSYQCSVSLARDKILLTGGYSWNSILARTESLNLTSGDSWQTLASLKTPRYLHACSPVMLEANQIGALVTGGFSDTYLNSTEIFHPQLNRWVSQGSTTVPRQGGVMAVLEGKPTLLGGFHDYDKYPTMVEQFDADTGLWFPLRSKLRKGRRYFGVATVPETLFPQCA